MTLAAAQVIAAVAARIINLPLAGADVFTSRAWPIADSALPAWRVIAVDEDIEPITVHGPWANAHRLQIEVHGLARAVQDLDDTLHALASEALTALFNEPMAPDALSALRGHVSLSLRRIERGMQSGGEAANGLVNITLRAEFQTLSNAPDTIL